MNISPIYAKLYLPSSLSEKERRSFQYLQDVITRLYGERFEVATLVKANRNDDRDLQHEIEIASPPFAQNISHQNGEFWKRGDGNDPSFSGCI